MAMRTRQELLKKMINRLIGWEEKSEFVAELMRKNQSDFQLLQQYDDQIKTTYSNEEKELVNQLMTYQKEVMNNIKEERTNLARQMKQMNQKDNVVKHYYQKKNQSMFIDRGL